MAAREGRERGREGGEISRRAARQRRTEPSGRSGTAAVVPAVPAGGGTSSPVRSAGVRSSEPCPCDSGQTYASCCEPLLDGAAAPTAEALMRSRFTAFAVGDEDYLFRTWHPRTRPEGPYCHAGTQWTSLTIHEVVGGGPGDETGVVEFTAGYRAGDGRGGVVADVLRERSRFVRRGSRWLYRDGQVR